MGPHRPWSDQRRSTLMLARVRALLTLEDLANATRLSTSQVHRMETDGGGSDAAWLAVARVLGEDVAKIRPIADSRQLTLLSPPILIPAGASSS